MLEPKRPPHLSDNSKVHRTSLDTELNSAWEYQSAKYCHSGPVTFATIIGKLGIGHADSRQQGSIIYLYSDIVLCKQYGPIRGLCRVWLTNKGTGIVVCIHAELTASWPDKCMSHGSAPVCPQAVALTSYDLLRVTGPGPVKPSRYVITSVDLVLDCNLDEKEGIYFRHNNTRLTQG